LSGEEGGGEREKGGNFPQYLFFYLLDFEFVPKAEVGKREERRENRKEGRKGKKKKKGIIVIIFYAFSLSPMTN